MARRGARESDGGELIVRLDIAGTLVFVATAVAAAMLFTSGPQWIAAVTALALFLVGIAAFLWSFWNAVQRSRGEQVAVTQLYLLAGGVAPAPVRRLMLSLLATQTVVGLATALARPNQPDGSPGTSLALGVLVPVFGFGLNGLWAAFHGRFDERGDTAVTPWSSRDDPKPDGDVPSGSPSIGKNEDHG
ncbi:MAG: hypothetical protein AAFP84_07745 [Actinomycetota bacterium]